LTNSSHINTTKLDEQSPEKTDWSFIATVAGTIASVAFGVWAILLAKKRGYPGDLTYFREPSIRLFADIVGNLPHLAVLYKGEPVKKNMTLLKGFLVNTGSKDITNEMVVSPLRIELADGYRWLEASAKSPLDAQEHAKIVDPKIVEFSLGLFRCNEFLWFQGMIEVGENKRWGGQLMFDHRIADTGVIKWTAVPVKPQALWKDLGMCLILLAFFGFFVVAIVAKHRPAAPFLLSIYAVLACWLVYAVASKNRKDRKLRKTLRLDTQDTTLS